MTTLTTDAIDRLNVDLLVLPVRGDGPEHWEATFGDAYVTARDDARATTNPSVVIREGDGPRRVAVVVADTPKGHEGWRWAAAAAAGLATSLKAQRVAIAAPEPDAVAPLTEGFHLGAYRFEAYRTADAAADIELAIHVEEATDAFRQLVAEADIRAEVTCTTRDLVNLPPDAKMPAALALRVQAEAEAAGLAAEVWDMERIEAEGMGGLLGVNRGSLDPARFVILEHAPEGHAHEEPIVLVGKTVTYDTGGLSLKPTKNSMDKMKADMAGGAAVVGAMLGAARLKLPLRVIALLPMSDNRPGGRAYAPGDVLTMHSGATVEVMNTDAEGRLLLADGLSYARELAPRLVIDVATLTGAQGVALGERVAAAITRPGSDDLADWCRQLGEETGDLAWPLPLYGHYAKQLKSDIADLQNVGGRMAGTITAAAFLDHFTRDDEGEPAYPWVHLDIARPAFLDSAYGYRPKGASGFGVSLLLGLLASEADA
ncbi:MAG: leucyl aminopeptidase [Bacteroidota bacterium]